MKTCATPAEAYAYAAMARVALLTSLLVLALAFARWPEAIAVAFTTLCLIGLTFEPLLRRPS